jgi:hypothetical protein
LGQSFELETNMKTYCITGLLLCSLAAAANAQTLEDGRVPADSDGTPSLVLPIVGQADDQGNPPRLRELLRQPSGDRPEPGSKPYRLSPEERHRMREQLRSQSGAEQSREKW